MANDDAAAAAAVRAGDESAFASLVERHRRELRVHCYRMLGAFADSEDLVQETFLRAWRSRGGFEARSTFRAWLYRIATNACLDVLAQRPRRVLPYDVAPAAGSGTALPLPMDGPWLEPCPDHLLSGAVPADQAPDAVLVAKETIELAFLAAIQHLPPRQRAVLIMRDVLGWSASDTAGSLDLSVAAVKSALQRARSTLRRHLPRSRLEWGSVAGATAEERVLLRRYVDAHRRGDGDALAALLSEDVRVSFPPLPLWVDGRDSFIAGSKEFADAGEYRYVETGANLQPAAAVYLRRPSDTVFRLLALEVLRIEKGRIAEIVDFNDPAVLAAFGLAPAL
ncbi:RNA polymerase subunit sigma-70 [Sphaerisporangium flaviroseum]